MTDKKKKGPRKRLKNTVPNFTKEVGSLSRKFTAFADRTHDLIPKKLRDLVAVDLNVKRGFQFQISLKTLRKNNPYFYKIYYLNGKFVLLKSKEEGTAEYYNVDPGNWIVLGTWTNLAEFKKKVRIGILQKLIAESAIKEVAKSNFLGQTAHDSEISMPPKPKSSKTK